MRWRTTGEHHLVQEKGRGGVLNDYHLRVGDITMDSNPPVDIPVKEQRFDETEIGKAKNVTLTEILPEKGKQLGTVEDLYGKLGLSALAEQIDTYDVFESIYSPGKIAILVSWADQESGIKWEPKLPDNAAALKHRRVRVIRDYGKFDRREAPQFYPDAAGRETLHAAQKCPIDHTK